MFFERYKYLKIMTLVSQYNKFKTFFFLTKTKVASALKSYYY